MDVFRIENLTFSYPEECPSLKEINLTIEEGQMVLLLGASGSGKTTLLKQLKPQLVPHGIRTGVIKYEGRRIEEVSYKRTTTEIGYVFQHPKHQIVTDRVWHELAFGLENLNMSQMEMELKMGEVASYFGIQNWLHKNTEELSGGQQQILNLASILMMSPKVILLDEPTSQLDPIAACRFLELVQRIKEELGITIVLSEHRKDDIYHRADKIVVMEEGRINYAGTPQDTAVYLGEKKSFLMPTVPKMCWNLAVKSNVMKKDKIMSRSKEAFIENATAIPVNLIEGRNWFRMHCEASKMNTDQEKSVSEHEPKREIIERQSEKNIVNKESFLSNRKRKKAIVVKELYYRYSRKENDILKHLQFMVYEGESFGIVGGNGTGKTTLLKVLAGYQKPYAGKVKSSVERGYLPQEPQLLFTCDTVREELGENVMRWVSLFQMQHLLDRHPYDLSGGEQQRLALLIVLNQNPQLLLLDEPTKGMDEDAKTIFGEILLSLQKEGKTIIMVTHDIAFAARYTDRCGLLFDGRLTGVQDTRGFFLKNQYYTTIARRVTKGIIPGIVLEEDVWQ